jgi:hypothetical protein
MAHQLDKVSHPAPTRLLALRIAVSVKERIELLEIPAMNRRQRRIVIEVLPRERQKGSPPDPV